MPHGRHTDDYVTRRAWIEEYFDRRAADAWARLTSDAPVGRIRARVREGRERMRRTLAGWLDQDLTGRRILDAGCGTGLLAADLAARGATVVAVDLSKTLVDLARTRASSARPGSVEFHAGDMLDPVWGEFDHVVAMDSLIHYRWPEMYAALLALGARARRSVLFTFVPRTPALAALRLVGQVLPRGQRSPAVEPVREDRVRATFRAGDWRLARTCPIRGGFYYSHAAELVRP